MTTRLLTALAAVALGGAALAQPPTAPPPHPTLEGLVREYRRLGLPLAPPDAELVRIPNSWLPRTGFHLGFRVPPTDGLLPFDPRTDSFRELEPKWVADLLWVAAQCYLNGRVEEARILYARALDAIRTPVPGVFETHGILATSWQQRVNGWNLHFTFHVHTVQDELLQSAYEYWSAGLESPDADRPAMLRGLKLTAGRHVSVYADLELTLAPRTSRPGTAEALIDDLTEFRSASRGGFSIGFGKPAPLHPSEGAYWKLAEMGFDAVPALIEHADDPRYTRTLYGQHHKLGVSYSLLRVGSITRELLNGLADDSIVTKDEDGKDWKAGARAWLEKARRVGEEKWLTAHALPAQGAARDTLYDPPNRVVFRALGAKYPARLAEVYRRVLRTRPRLASDVLAQEVAASRLPHNAKVALLAEGVAHPLPGHQHAALRALAGVDAAAFRAALLARLAAFPREVKKGYPFRTPEAAIAGVVDLTDDPACWAALAVASRRATVDLRLQVLAELGGIWASERNPAARPERLRFLLGFLADTNGQRGWTPYAYPPDGPTVEVRDYAAVLLAQELGWGFDFKPERGPEARRVIRVAVRDVATRELAARK